MYNIGIDVGGTNLAAGLVAQDGTIVSRANTPVQRDFDAQRICHELVQLADRVSGALPRGEIASVGIGVPGKVDQGQGSVMHAPNIALLNTPVREFFQQRWNLPVYLGNDADCAALGEAMVGAARACPIAAMVTLGTGIGGGLVIDGKLFTGCAGAGMEVGHMITHPNGRACGCGSKGCWEQYASATALIRMTRKAMQAHLESALWDICEQNLEKVEGRTPFQCAALGDAVAKTVIDAYINEVSYGLIALANILQPQVICLGGGISNAEERLLLLPLRERVERGMFDCTKPTKLLHAQLGNDAGIVGAAFLHKAL